MRINLLPVYSKLASSNDVPEEVASNLPSGMCLSQHQVETYQALKDTEVDVVINTAMTGDGKSLAAYLPTLVDSRRHAFGMYPTIELSRDQQRQFDRYALNFSRKIRSEALWGARLGELARERSAKRRGDVLKERFNNCQVILTNPDIFTLVMNYSYGSNIFSDQELPYTLANNYDDLIFDEFHIFSMPQIVAALTAMLFFLEYTPDTTPRFLFSSATPDPTFLQMMKRTGVRFREIHGIYSSNNDIDRRHVLHQALLVLHKLGNGENAEVWLEKNLNVIIDHWKGASQKPKGAIILNSVVTARRVAHMLDIQLKQYRIKVGEVTGLTDDVRRREAMQEADLIVGTSTIDVGVDFNISLLIFETIDAGSFLQRLGRLGRVRQDEKAFDRYEAHTLFSSQAPWIYDGFVNRLQEQGISDGDTIDRPGTLREIVLEQGIFPSATAFKPYAKRWGVLQAAHVIAVLEGSRREQGFQTTVQALRERYKALFDLNDLTRATGRYWTLAGKKRSLQEQQQCRAILDEVLSFRGSSPFQAAIWDNTVEPPAFIGYDTLNLVQNANYNVIDKEMYKAVLEQFPSSVQNDAEEEMRWAIKGKGEQPLILKILGWEGVNLKDYTRQVVVLKGCIVNSPRTSYDLGTLNQFLRRQLLVCYFTLKEPGELRRLLRLPPLFPLYSVEQSGRFYTASFGKTALLLESEMLRFRGRDEESEAIFC